MNLWNYVSIQVGRFCNNSCRFKEEFILLTLSKQRITWCYTHFAFASLLARIADTMLLVHACTDANFGNTRLFKSNTQHYTFATRELEENKYFSL